MKARYVLHFFIMRKRQRLFFLLPTILSFIAVTYIVLTFPPGKQFHLLSVAISVLVLFFLLVFSFSFALISFILKKKLQGILVATFLVIYLLFLYFSFTKPLYQILLLLIFISVELFFWQRKGKKQQ